MSYMPLMKVLGRDSGFIHLSLKDWLILRLQHSQDMMMMFYSLLGNMGYIKWPKIILSIQISKIEQYVLDLVTKMKRDATINKQETTEVVI